MKKLILLGVMLLPNFIYAQTISTVEKIEKAMSFEKKPSIISIPLDISLTDLQNQINANLPDLIYEDDSFTDNGNDGLKAKVSRKGNMIFTENKDGVLTYEVPLKVWVQKEISVLGISQAPSTSFELKIKFASKFKITEDYQIETKTQGLGYTWITKPVLKSGLMDIPIGPIVGKVITSNFSMFSEQIDKAIKEGFSLKPYVLDAWNMALKPIQVSEEYNTWLKASPVGVYYTPLKSEGMSIKSTLGIKIFVETLVGTPNLNPNKVTDIPKLKNVLNIPEVFELQLLNNVTYSEANVIAQRMFLNQTFEFSNGKFKINIKELDISHDEDEIVFNIKTTGSFKGTIQVKGKPIYDDSKGMVVLEKAQMDIKTKNVLLKAAAWLLEGTLEKKIQQEFGVPVKDIIEYSKKSILETINTEVVKGILMKGEIIEIKPSDVLVTEEGILAVINSKAKVQVIVKGM